MAPPIAGAPETRSIMTAPPCRFNVKAGGTREQCMSDPGQVQGNPFWEFTLSVYRREGVSQACIALQDRLRLDVNFLLLAVFAGTRGFSLEAMHWNALDALAKPWRENVIHPLRHVRRWLKEQHSLPAPSVDPIRKAVLAQEIEAEGMQQRLMWAALAVPSGDPSLQIAARNLASYCRFSRVTVGADDLAALMTLLSQALHPATGDAARAALAEARINL
jgi:uncharacterized protein (TIGR02444 family)